MGQPPQSIVDWHHPPRIITFALGYPLVNGLIVRSRDTTTETPAQCIMELPAWGKDGCYLAPPRCCGAHTQVEPIPHPHLCPCWQLTVPMQCEHPPASAKWTGHHHQWRAAAGLGEAGKGRLDEVRHQGAESWQLRTKPREVGRRWSPGSKSSDTPSIVPAYIIYTNLNLNTNTNSQMKQLRILRQGL